MLSEITDVSALEATGTWWAAELKMGQERSFSGDMFRHGVPTFVPLRTERRRARGERAWRTIIEPLFSGYGFFCGDAEAPELARTTKKLLRLIPVVDQRRLVRELRVVADALAHDPSLSARRIPTVGKRYVVAPGHLFAGVEVIVNRVRGTTCAVLAGVGASLDLEIDAAALEPV